MTTTELPQPIWDAVVRLGRSNPYFSDAIDDELLVATVLDTWRFALRNDKDIHTTTLLLVVGDDGEVKCFTGSEDEMPPEIGVHVRFYLYESDDPNLPAVEEWPDDASSPDGGMTDRNEDTRAKYLSLMERLRADE